MSSDPWLQRLKRLLKGKNMKKMLNLSFEMIVRLVQNSRRLLVMAWEDHKGKVIMLAVMSLLIAGIPFLQSGAIALLINQLVAGIGTNAAPQLSLLIVLVVAAGLVPDIFYGVKGYIDKQFWITMQEKFELMFLKRKGEIDIAAYENPKFNDLLNKAEARGTYPMVNLLEAQFSNMQNVVGVVVASIVLIGLDWRIFLLILGATIPKFVVEARYGHGVWGIFDSNAESRRRFFDIRNHFYSLTNLAELKLFQNVNFFHSMLSDHLRDFNAQQKLQERKRVTYQLGTVAISGTAIAFAMILIIQKVIAGNLEIGTMTFVLGSIAALQNGLSGFFLSIAGQYQHSLFVTDLFKVMDTQPMIERAKNPIVLDSTKAPEIVFENVSFAYPGTDRLVLKDFSLTIRAGEKLALVGVNGAGKTTFVKLICRIYDPTAGRILVNGHDLREVDLDGWHSQLGVLFQDYSTYHFLAKDVIAMGRRNGSPQAHMDKVKGAAQMSGADAFIEEWEKQYDQMIGREFTDGIDPSKGQLQKLALARSFYRNPGLLILDEPTASIDAEAEAKIFEKLESLPKNKTVILISHRFSTVRRADQICVVKDGTIEELGTHDELMQLEKTYARLFEIQAAGYRG